MAGLRVADAGILPTVVSGNTDAAAKIGEEAAAVIADDLRMEQSRAAPEGGRF